MREGTDLQAQRLVVGAAEALSVVVQLPVVAAP
jgi:hypothetical protein